MASIDRRPGGRYQARWREYPGGPQKTRTFGRKADAERFLVDVQHRLLTGTYTPPTAGQITLEAYASEWLGRRSWAPSTHDRIERALRLHILPAYDDDRVRSIVNESPGVSAEDWLRTTAVS